MTMEQNGQPAEHVAAARRAMIEQRLDDLEQVVSRLRDTLQVATIAGVFLLLAALIVGALT